MLVQKVLAYITHAGQLLVFRQPLAPDQGIQVPGGSVEPGETLAEAALREAREETGLSKLALRAELGSARYELQVDVGPPHLRHFFHIEAAEMRAPRWQHQEPPTATRSATVLRELWWEPLPLSDGRALARLLDWQMGALLSQLRSPRR
ncbi:MAG TPA: NUDIX domain-containing protein [Polyangiaceae bacterium]|nr:NUDIX domain-containing protein [Polyangiaceae bacterium]